jgi:flavin reductase (DIM6/NTAB) family NADH-FMN oxidoreductase RutF
MTLESEGHPNPSVVPCQQRINRVDTVATSWKKHRNAGNQWTTMLTETPVLENSLAAFDCEVTEILPRDDHAIVVGRVCARTSPGCFPPVCWQSG